MFSLKLDPRRSTLAAPLLVALLVVSTWSPASVQAQPTIPLDIRSAAELAVGRSQTLKASEASAGAARSMAVVAGQRPDPVLRVSLDNMPINGADRWSTSRDFMTMRSVGVMQMLPNEAKRRSRSQRYELQALAALAQREQQAIEVRRTTALAWFERRAADQRLALLDRQIEASKQQVSAAEAALRGAKGSQVDWIAAKDAWMVLEQSRLQTLADQAVARQSLARWTGLPLDHPLADMPRLSVTALDALSPVAVMNRHPELAAQKARILVAQADADVARLERDPDWSVEVMLSQRGPAYSDMVSIGLSVPLPINRRNRQDMEWAARLSEAEAMDSEWNDARQARTLEIEATRAGWTAALAQLDVIDRERTPLANQRLESTLAAYRAGTTPLTAVLEARQSNLMLAMERIETELRAARLWTALEFLLLPESAAVAGR
jgi:outer membrane protein TolC